MSTITEEQTASENPQVESTEPDDSQDVDLSVLKDVYREAMAKLDEVRKAERATTGAAKTTLADIGRQAILSWRPLEYQTYGPTPRSPNGKAPKRTPFRFKMSAKSYAEATARIHAVNMSTTQVVEEALSRFALTGR